MGVCPQSAIVLVGGSSRRFGREKGLLMLANKPLSLHVLDRISTVVDEIIVVASSKTQRNTYKFLMPRAKLIVDKCDSKTPLVGALAGFESASNEYSLLLACDTPFVSSQIVSLLLELCVHRDAAIPRWPNGYLEPLQAAYNTRKAAAAASKALEEGKLNMHSMIAHLEDVIYVSTTVLKQTDPTLSTLFNINTPQDLRKARIKLQEAHPR